MAKTLKYYFIPAMVGLSAVMINSSLETFSKEGTASEKADNESSSFYKQSK